MEGGTCHKVARDECAYADRPIAVGAKADGEEDHWNLRRVKGGGGGSSRTRIPWDGLFAPGQACG